MENKTFRVNVKEVSMDDILKFINDIKIYVLENRYISVVNLIDLFTKTYDNVTFHAAKYLPFSPGLTLQNILLNDIKVFPKANREGQIDSFDILFPEIEDVSSNEMIKKDIFNIIMFLINDEDVSKIVSECIFKNFNKYIKVFPKANREGQIEDVLSEEMIKKDIFNIIMSLTNDEEVSKIASECIFKNFNKYRKGCDKL